MFRRRLKHLKVQDEDRDSDSGSSAPSSPASEMVDPLKVELWNKKQSLKKEVHKLKRKQASFFQYIACFSSKLLLGPLSICLPKIPFLPRYLLYVVYYCNKSLYDSKHSLVGTLLAFAFVQPSDIQDMHAQLTLLMDHYDITLPQLDFDFSRFETEWNKVRSNIPELWKFNRDGREFQVGESMKARGLTAEYPVVLIPGVISTVRLNRLL